MHVAAKTKTTTATAAIDAAAAGIVVAITEIALVGAMSRLIVSV